jgi:hypothetical protein
VIPPLREFGMLPIQHNLHPKTNSLSTFSKKGFLSEIMTLKEREEKLNFLFQSSLNGFKQFYWVPIDSVNKHTKKRNSCENLNLTKLNDVKSDALLCSELHWTPRGVRVSLFLLAKEPRRASKSVWLREETIMKTDFTISQLQETWVDLLTKFYYLLGQKAKVLNLEHPYFTIDAGSEQGFQEQQIIAVGLQKAVRMTPQTNELIEIDHEMAFKGQIIKTYLNSSLCRFESIEKSLVNLPIDKLVVFDEAKQNEEKASIYWSQGRLMGGSPELGVHSVSEEEMLTSEPTSDIFNFSDKKKDLAPKLGLASTFTSIRTKDGEIYTTPLPLLIFNSVYLLGPSLQTSLGEIDNSASFNYHLNNDGAGYFINLFGGLGLNIETLPFFKLGLYGSIDIGRIYHYDKKSEFTLGIFELGPKISVSFEALNSIKFYAMGGVSLFGLITNKPARVFLSQLAFLREKEEFPLSIFFKWAFINDEWLQSTIGLFWRF